MTARCVQPGFAPGPFGGHTYAAERGCPWQGASKLVADAVEGMDRFHLGCGSIISCGSF